MGYKKNERREAIEMNGDVDFHEFDHIATFDEMLKVFTNPIKFAAMYRATARKFRTNPCVTLPVDAVDAIRNRGLIKFRYGAITLVEANKEAGTIKVNVPYSRKEGLAPSIMKSVLVAAFSQYCNLKEVPKTKGYLSVRNDFHSTTVEFKFLPDAGKMMNGPLQVAFENRLKRLDEEDAKRVVSINEEIAKLQNELELIKLRRETRREDETKRLIEFIEK